jgi:hypothetical protein
MSTGRIPTEFEYHAENIYFPVGKAIIPGDYQMLLMGNSESEPWTITLTIDGIQFKSQVLPVLMIGYPHAAVRVLVHACLSTGNLASQADEFGPDGVCICRLFFFSSGIANTSQACPTLTRQHNPRTHHSAHIDSCGSQAELGMSGNALLHSVVCRFGSSNRDCQTSQPICLLGQTRCLATI